MADAHWGYGFPIGGVAAFDLEKGVISPGGIGFDINCGMRLVRTNLRYSEVKPKVKELVDLLFRLVPTGVGVKGFVKVNQSQFEEVMRWGVKWCAENGYGWEDDVEKVEEGGFIKGADPSKVSQAGLQPGHKPARHAGLGQPLLRDAGRRPRRGSSTRRWGSTSGSSTTTRSSSWSTAGAGASATRSASDYLRVFDARDEEVRHSGEGQGARLRALLVQGGPGLLRRDGVRRQHGVREQAGHSPQGHARRSRRSSTRTLRRWTCT